MDTSTKAEGRATPWNKGKLLGQKPPLKLKEIWAIRIRLQLGNRARERALFNLAISSGSVLGLDLVEPFLGNRHVGARFPTTEVPFFVTRRAGAMAGTTVLLDQRLYVLAPRKILCCDGSRKATKGQDREYG